MEEGREEIWGVKTFILISTPRKIGAHANAHSKGQIALGFYSRHQSHALSVHKWSFFVSTKDANVSQA